MTILYFTYLFIILFTEAIAAQEFRLRKRDYGAQAREPFGLVYSKGRLVGVLEPYTDLYKLAPISNVRQNIEEIPLQSVSESRSLTDPSEDSEKDESGQNDYTRYTDEKYPMVLTDFKINSKLSAMKANKQDNWQSSRVEGKSHHATEADGYGGPGAAHLKSKKAISNEQISELSSALGSALHRIKESDSSEKVEAIEEDLRGLLSDVGLIDSETLQNKREAIKRDSNVEDENLEEGQNNIQIVKTTDIERNKRYEATPGVDVTLDTKAEEDLKATEPTENEENKREATTVNIKNYQSEGDVYIRNKRHEVTTENSDIMKNLEKSGELTVSGNKSPLASSETSAVNTEKRKEGGDSTSSTGAAIDDYEKRLEQNLQQKIEAIKEEVKREIASLHARNAPNVDESQRRKRGTSNTLQEKESKEINPLDHPEEPLVSYIRTKRNVGGRNKREAYELDETPMDEGDDLEILETEEEIENDEDRLPNNDFINNPNTTITVLESTTRLINTTSSTPAIKSSLPDPVSLALASHTESPVVDLSKRQRLNGVTHARRKRAETLVPDGYAAYRAEDQESDEEGDESEDDGFDDRTANLRELNRYLLDYRNPLQYDEPYGESDYPVRRYVSNLNSDLAPRFLHDPSAYIRRKRHNFDRMVALHGEAPMIRHLAAARERNMRQFEDRARQKRNFGRKSQPVEDEQQRIADLSDTDLFGALPQSYEGELSRFKRVKRKVGAVKGAS
ncbi:uncharacterized protein LOC116167092 [Photinus pyralis]|uniref:uncharacterized protein LOC116167092 n=1 Tax=Photinus pyralis TaxID=7054 RepID=UPI00126745DD|nr:uncharacterized protein LOC116167092 [Photinus pyralis]